MSALLREALLDELMDSLTAVGSWLAIAELKAQNDLGEALSKAVCQHYRAGKAFRRLRNTQPVDRVRIDITDTV